MAQFPCFQFSEEWEILGPFQIGTREASWGADPLEYLGGFRALAYNESDFFPSSLASNSTISWSRCSARLSDPDLYHSGASLTVSYPQIDWTNLQATYGWPALQWQAWARGKIIIQSETSKNLALFNPGILELWIDGKHYFGGDFYHAERAALSLHLDPGIHTIDVRLVRDVRSMGAVGEPTLEVNLEIYASSGLLEPALNLYMPVLISDLVGNGPDAALASPYISVTLRNDASVDVFVDAVEADQQSCLAELVSKDRIKLAPGQTRPIAARIACVGPIEGHPPHRDILIRFRYHFEGQEGSHTLSFDAHPRLRGKHEPHRVTFMHPAGIVSYAILRPPSANATRTAQSTDTFPVLLSLHGAAVEADSDEMKHSLDPVPDLPAWALFPTGVTTWCGDDWHVWGFADVEAAIAAIPDWIEQVGWDGPGVDLDRWLVTGHSNGGQGALYTLTHRPDKIIAAAPVSGYSSIQNYVPYTFWQPAEPARAAVVQAALNSYRHELLLRNVQGIPILLQHGSADDNVPTYHSRMLNQMIREAGAESDYYEVPDKPHWWPGVMTTEPLQEFYHRHLQADSSNLSPGLDDFTLIVADPGDMGSRYGILVLQLVVPGQLGRIDVSFDIFTRSCSLKLSNIRQFQLPENFRDCSWFYLNDQVISALPRRAENTTFTLVKEKWQTQIIQQADIPPRQPRLGRQLGTMDAILRSRGPFSIVHHSAAAKSIALQVSRNWYQYYAADTGITDDYDSALSTTGNLVSVAIGGDLPIGFWAGFPLQVWKERIDVRRLYGIERSYHYTPRQGLAAIFLRPLALGRLELVIWGADEKSLDVAARLVPLMTGTGQPDFIIMDRSMLWKGVQGALGLGFFDADWDVSPNSFLS